MAQEKPRRGRPRTGPDPERFQVILDASALLFFRAGYSATSIQDIANEVGILKGSLYYYIDSKEDLLFEVIKRTYDEAVARVERLGESTATPLERLREFVHVHVTFSIEKRVNATVQVRELRHLSDERRIEITAGGDIYTDILRAILRDGQAGGAIDPDLDVRVTSLGLLGLLNSVLTWYHEGGDLSPEEVAAHFVGLVFGAVVSDETVDASGSVEVLRRAEGAALLAAPAS